MLADITNQMTHDAMTPLRHQGVGGCGPSNYIMFDFDDLDGTEELHKPLQSDRPEPWEVPETKKVCTAPTIKPSSPMTDDTMTPGADEDCSPDSWQASSDRMIDLNDLNDGKKLAMAADEADVVPPLKPESWEAPETPNQIRCAKEMSPGILGSWQPPDAGMIDIDSRGEAHGSPLPEGAELVLPAKPDSWEAPEADEVITAPTDICFSPMEGDTCKSADEVQQLPIEEEKTSPVSCEGWQPPNNGIFDFDDLDNNPSLAYGVWREVCGEWSPESWEGWVPPNNGMFDFDEMAKYEKYEKQQQSQEWWNRAQKGIHGMAAHPARFGRSAYNLPASGFAQRYPMNRR